MSARSARRVGAAIMRHSPWAVVQRVFVAVAVAILALVVTAPTIVVAQFHGADAVAQARGPRFPDLFPDDPVKALWLADTVVLESGQQAALVALAALTANPAPPPGVDVWPGPGQIVVSPAWERHADELTFGALDAEIIGVIGPEGLVDDGEIIAYIGGTAAQVGNGGGTAITGFGSPWVPLTGTMLYRQPVWWLLLGVVLLVVAPAVFLLTTALRMGAGSRARRDRILGELGAPTRFAAQVRLGEVRSAIGVGAAAAFAGCALLLTVDVPVVGTGFTLRAAANRSLWWALLSATTAAVVGAWFLARSGVGLRSERAREPAQRSAPALVDACLAPCVAAAVVIAINLSSLHHVEAIVLPLFWGGLLAVLTLLPRCVRGWLAWLAQRARRRATAAGDPGAMVALAQIEARPRPYGRFGAVAASTIVLLAVAGRFSMLWGADMAEAQAHAGAASHAVGFVGIPWSAWSTDGDPDAVIEAALDTLADDFAVVGVPWERDAVIGTGADLAAFGFRAGEIGTSDPETNAALGGIAHEMTARTGSPDAGNTSRLYLRPRDGSLVDREAVNALLADIVLPPLRVAFAGESSTLGAAVNLHQARWLDWFATAGTLILVTALWAGFTNELLRLRHNLLPAQAFAPDRRFTRAATGLRIVLPCVLFAAIGSGIALLVSLPLMSLGTALVTPPWAAIISGSVIVIGSSVVAWLTLSRNIAARSMSLRFAQTAE